MGHFTLNSHRRIINAPAPSLQVEGKSPIYWAWGESKIDKNQIQIVFLLILFLL
jgi:hypothetical protein